ncbi:hypothetical protein [Azospirillum picis]|uniref:Uncharacterized protein n=1 Tax=Azospirillum picis TaxID=488438 RepID=A0ABU0MSF7_9PROT|nr:hypothetical protein [Azospirillum picis]MBP2301975.1 hypothetical protein [Azospirillum picis]MDQ0536424.1 hypothetical protein [Azospirillum picis]
MATATIDSSASRYPTPREAVRTERESPVINGGHNGGPVEIKGEMSFWDFLDVINPLQHIPLVNTIYREITGDTIQPSMQVMGDMLYGGVIGGMASIANAVIEESTGKNVGDTVMASLGFGGDHPANAEAVADAPGGPAAAASPAEAAGPAAAPTGSLAGALAAAGPPVRLGAEPPPAGNGASPALVAQLAAGGAVPHPTKMPPRDTPLASSALAKHSIPRNVAPAAGPVLANARVSGPAPPQAQDAPRTGAGPAGALPNESPGATAPMQAGPMPVPTEMLSETMMRNLAKYEQSRKAVSAAAQSAGAMRVSG